MVFLLRCGLSWLPSRSKTFSFGRRPDYWWLRFRSWRWGYWLSCHGWSCRAWPDCLLKLTNPWVSSGSFACKWARICRWRLFVSWVPRSAQNVSLLLWNSPALKTVRPSDLWPSAGPWSFIWTSRSFHLRSWSSPHASCAVWTLVSTSAPRSLPYLESSCYWPSLFPAVPRFFWDPCFLS